MAGAGPAAAAMITFRQRLANLGRWLGAWVSFPMSVLVFMGLVVAVFTRWQTLHGTSALAVVEQKQGPVGSGRTGLFDVQVRFIVPQQGVKLATLRLSKESYQHLTPGATIPVRYRPNRPTWALPDTEKTIDLTHALTAVVGIIMLCTGYSQWRTWRKRRPDGYLPES